MRKSVSLLTGAFVALAAATASADMVSAYAFIPDAPTVREDIDYGSGAAWNDSATATAFLIAPLVQFTNDNTPSAVFWVNGNGQSLTCQLISRNLDTGSSWSDAASTTSSSSTSLSISLSLPAGSNYAHSGQCNLPKKTGSGELAFLYGAKVQ